MENNARFKTISVERKDLIYATIHDVYVKLHKSLTGGQENKTLALIVTLMDVALHLICPWGEKFDRQGSVYSVLRCHSDSMKKIYGVSTAVIVIVWNNDLNILFTQNELIKLHRVFSNPISNKRIIHL